LFFEFGNSEVEDFHESVLTEHHVFRLDIAVENACLMRGGESARHLNSNIKNFVKRHLR